MQKNPFVILECSESVTQNELYEAYMRQKAKYSDKRFALGEEGAIACEKLDEIETAYREADRILQTRFYVTAYDNAYEGIEQLIKEKKLNQAQEELDKISNRDAEWHYLQSMIYYCKRWYNEAREQLKAAISMAPNNEKYILALKKLDEKLYGNQNAQQSQNSGNFYAGGDSSRSYRNTSADYGTRRGATACDCCSTMICADCCCECMGGDLIACC